MKSRIRISPHIVISIESEKKGEILCEQCGKHDNISLPINTLVFVKVTRAFHRRHLHPTITVERSKRLPAPLP